MGLYKRKIFRENVRYTISTKEKSKIQEKINKTRFQPRKEVRFEKKKKIRKRKR